MATCKIHEDAPNPNCAACKAGLIDTPTLYTETERINRVRDALQEKARNGMLGVIAARANVWESKLREWCDDPAKVPLYGELIDIQAALGLEAIFDPEEEFPKDDLGDDYRGGGG